MLNHVICSLNLAILDGLGKEHKSKTVISLFQIYSVSTIFLGSY